MDQINLVISENLKRLREQRKMSLDAVARLSGVSKSMLGQIERGEVNPTVSTVWKISNGLKISFTEFMNHTEKEYEVVDCSSVQPFLEDNGRYRNFPLFSFDDERRFEVYYIELDSGSRLAAEAHAPGTQEFITVFSGCLEVLVNGTTLSTEAEGALRFKADRPHRYYNPGQQICRLSMVIYYPKL